MFLDIDPHGRVAPQSDEARRALADRAGRFALLPAAADLLIARRTPAAGGEAPPPRCILAGDLSGFPIADFIAFIHQSHLSGRLTVSSGGLDRSVTFTQGEVRNAQSEAMGERIGEVALRLGYLTADQLSEVVAADGERPLGKALVDRGFISAPDLWKCLHEQVTVVFHAILLSREGVFGLMEEPPTDRPSSQLSVNTQSLLMDGIRRIDEMGLFRAKIPGPHAFIQRREPSRPTTLQGAEMALLGLVDGRRTVADLAAAAHLSEFDAIKVLFHLAEAGYVEASEEAVVGSEESPDERLQILAGGMNEILRAVAQAVVDAGGGEPFLAGARAFLADPNSRHATLWTRLGPAADGALDVEQLLGNLGALRGTALTRLEPSGKPARFLFEAMRELMFFYLFQAGQRLPREEDDALSLNVKRSFEALEALR